jgi:hypothetical protein
MGTAYFRAEMIWLSEFGIFNEWTAHRKFCEATNKVFHPWPSIRLGGPLPLAVVTGKLVYGIFANHWFPQLF